MVKFKTFTVRQVSARLQKTQISMLLKADVDEWLKHHDNKIEILSHQQSILGEGDDMALLTTIFYKE